MDFNSNNEKKNKRNRYFNIIFLGIFLTEIIIYIIGIVILPIRSDWLIILVSVIFMSGIYTFFKKTLLYLSAFCVVNMIQCIILIDFAIHYRYTILGFLEYAAKPNVYNNYEEYVLNNGIDDRMILIIPNIIASGLIIFFVFLYIILIFMTWKNEYWDFISRTKILIPNDKIKKSYIIYKFYNFLLYILLNLIVVFNLSDIYGSFSYYEGMYDVTFSSLFTLFILTFSLKIVGSHASYTSPYLELNIIIKVIKILSSFTLTLSLKIIRKELKFGIFIIYGSLIVQGIFFYFWSKYKMYYLIDNNIDQMLSINNMPALPITRILGLILLGLTFINAILCHLNFGKHHIFLLKFNPNLDKEYEYSNDLNDDDDDDEEEEEEKDEKISEKLNRYWNFIKKTSILLVE